MCRRGVVVAVVVVVIVGGGGGADVVVLVGVGGGSGSIGGGGVVPVFALTTGLESNLANLSWSTFLTCNTKEKGFRMRTHVPGHAPAAVSNQLPNSVRASGTVREAVTLIQNLEVDKRCDSVQKDDADASPKKYVNHIA